MRILHWIKLCWTICYFNYHVKGLKRQRDVPFNNLRYADGMWKVDLWGQTFECNDLDTLLEHVNAYGPEGRE